MDFAQILNKISVEQIRTHIQALEGVRHPVAAPEALERAARYVWVTLESFGCEMTEHNFTEGDREFSNIIGTYPGTRNPERCLIILAHYDTVSASPGANDNASGVAGMLELARVLKSIRLDRSIHFIGVNLEERAEEGNLESSIARGSRALAVDAKENKWKIEGVIDLEEIAYAGDTVTQRAPPGISFPEIGDFVAVVGNEKSADLVRGFMQSIAQFGIPLPNVGLIVHGNGEVFADSRRSDHAPFWDNGYKAIMLTDTINFRTPHYHQPTDTLETLNLSFAAQVCRATAGLVLMWNNRILTLD